VLLDYDPTNEPKYTRTENVEADQRPAFVLPEGSSDFTRACPGARRLGTHTVLGRGAIRYACAASAGQDTAPKPEVISLDQATRLLLRQSGAGYTAEAMQAAWPAEIPPLARAESIPLEPMARLYRSLVLPVR